MNVASHLLDARLLFDTTFAVNLFYKCAFISYSQFVHAPNGVLTKCFHLPQFAFMGQFHSDKCCSTSH